MHDNLHIVTPDVPTPTDADTLQDIYLKIKTFHEAGIKIHLHSFEFGKGTSENLEQYCHRVKYYRRNNANQLLSSSQIPYSVASRSNRELVKNLFADDFPILYEGISTTFPLLWSHSGNQKLQHLNLSRDDEKYYKNLAALMPWGFNKLTYLFESRKCKSYLKKLNQNPKITISSSHAVMCIQNFSFAERQGSFCLYFGKLSDKENEYAALWLLENIFNEVEIPFVIAGSNPSPQLEQAAHLRLHTCLVGDPTERELDELIKKAQIILLPSFIDSSPLNRLSKSLSMGRFVMVNQKAVGKSDWGSFCEVAGTPEVFKENTLRLFNEPFSIDSHNARTKILSEGQNYKNEIKDLFGKLNLHYR
jgi:hypothetical protein